MAGDDVLLLDRNDAGVDSIRNSFGGTFSSDFSFPIDQLIIINFYYNKWTIIR